MDIFVNVEDDSSDHELDLSFMNDLLGDAASLLEDSSQQLSVNELLGLDPITDLDNTIACGKENIEMHDDECTSQVDTLYESELLDLWRGVPKLVIRRKRQHTMNVVDTVEEKPRGNMYDCVKKRKRTCVLKDTQQNQEMYTTPKRRKTQKSTQGKRRQSTSNNFRTPSLDRARLVGLVPK